MRARVHDGEQQKRQVGLPVRRIGGKQSGTVPKSASAPPAYEKKAGGGRNNPCPERGEEEEKGVVQQARHEARLRRRRTSFLGLGFGFEEAAFQVRALYDPLRTYVAL
jgi:hypothetical protein